MNMKDLKSWTHAEKIGAMTYQLYTIADCEVCGCDCKTGNTVNLKGVTKTRLRAEGLTVVARGHEELGACDALDGIAVCPGCYKDEDEVEVVDIHLDDCVDADEAIRLIDEQLDKPEEAFDEVEKTASAMPRHTRREDWLHEAVPYLRELILNRSSDGAAECDQDRPEPYLSVGWPKKSRGKAARIGECWSAQHESGRAHIFVSPELADAVRVLDVLVHELIHDYVGLDCGHKGAFKRLAQDVGLEGKMTATVAGDALRLELERVALLCGHYPHEALTQEPRATPKQRCRQRKYKCPECGQILRAATDDLQAICEPRAPRCTSRASALSAS